MLLSLSRLIIVFLSTLNASAHASELVAKTDRLNWSESTTKETMGSECPDGHCCNTEGDCPTGLCCDEESNLDQQRCDCNGNDCDDGPIDIPR